MILTCLNCGQKNRVPASKLTATVRCGKCKTDLTPPRHPIDADDATFDDIVRDARVPVLVDFWASWCRPCHMAAPEVERVAREMAGRAIVLKVNTERHPNLAARFGVSGIPNFVVVKGGNVVFQQAGVVPADEMKRWLEIAANRAA